MSSDVQIARAEVLRSAVWARVIVCVTITIGGMLCLAAGIGMVVVGLSNDQAFSCVSEAQKVKVAGIGAISMVASAMWAYFSHKTYAQPLGLKDGDLAGTQPDDSGASPPGDPDSGDDARQRGSEPIATGSVIYADRPSAHGVTKYK